MANIDFELSDLISENFSIQKKVELQNEMQTQFIMENSTCKRVMSYVKNSSTEAKMDTC
jgi:hypothetical protein